MDYSTAREIVLHDYPSLIVESLAESDKCWVFLLINPGEEKYIQQGIPAVGLSLAVDKETREVFHLVPGSDAFWKYMPDLKKVPVPQE